MLHAAVAVSHSEKGRSSVTDSSVVSWTAAAALLTAAAAGLKSLM